VLLIDRDAKLEILEPVPVGEPVHLCLEEWEAPRRSIDFQPLNSHATRELTIPCPLFIRPDLSPKERRKPYLMLGMFITLMLGMVITVFHFTLMITIIPPLSPHGADTTIVLHLRFTLLRGIVIQDVIMKLLHHFLRIPNVWMICFFGL